MSRWLYRLAGLQQGPNPASKPAGHGPGERRCRPFANARAERHALVQREQLTFAPFFPCESDEGASTCTRKGFDGRRNSGESTDAPL